MTLHFRAIRAVLMWGCRYWHHPGDDECFAATGDPALDAATWAWASRLPRRLWGAAA